MIFTEQNFNKYKIRAIIDGEWGPKTFPENSDSALLGDFIINAQYMINEQLKDMWLNFKKEKKMKFDEESFNEFIHAAISLNEGYGYSWQHLGYSLFSYRKGCESEKPPCEMECISKFMKWALEDFKKFLKSKWIEYGKLQNEKPL